MKTELATFAAGCFWGVEELFRNLPAGGQARKGVAKTTVGYTGGKKEHPTYKDVCSDTTGHAEAVQIEYDPSQISYDELLQIFWENHDPTTPNRQGPDVGSQYRSVIFYHTPDQKTRAEQSKEALEKSGKYKTPVVTEILAAEPFYPAEEYHQQYLQKRGLGSCHV